MADVNDDSEMNLEKSIVSSVSNDEIVSEFQTEYRGRGERR